MSRITKYALSDLYEMSSGISSTKEQAGHGAPFVSFSTVFNNYFLPDELPDLMDTNEKEQEIYSIKAGDVLITRTSETIDELAMSCVAVKDYPKATYSGFTKRLRPKKEGIAYPKYMAFYFRSELFRKAVTNNAFMTLRASFNEDIFTFLDVYLPDYEEQVRIGDMLYAVERKIQKNREINDYLCNQIQLLFSYFFNLSSVPETWSKGVLSDIADITMGQSPSGNSYNIIGKGCPFYQGSTDFGAIFPTIRMYTNKPSRYALALDTLLSVRAPVGSLNIAFENCCIGRGLASIHGKNDNNIFVRYLIKNNRWYFDNINNSGTTFGSITKDDLFGMPITIPEDKLVAMFEHKSSLIEQQIYANEQQIRELQSLRNWLLPVLMNGQATIID